MRIPKVARKKIRLYRDNVKNYKSFVIPARTAGIRTPWMAFVKNALTVFYTRFYWTQCNIDKYIHVLWILGYRLKSGHFWLWTITVYPERV